MNSTSQAGMHPMLSSVVHRPFNTARKEVGCCEFSHKQFDAALQHHLPVLQTEFMLDEVARLRLWHAMMSGEVIAVETLDDETLSFHVRGRFSSKYVDMKLAYEKDNWQVLAVTSIHTRPFLTSPRRTLSLLAGVVVVAGVTGFLLGTHTNGDLTQQAVASWATVHGFELVEKQTAPTAPSPVNTSSAGTVEPSVQHFSFTFRQGMTVHDISVFLQQHQLITDAYAFDKVLQQTGVAKSVWPGTYTFATGMSQDQLLQVLKTKPSHG